MASVLGIRFGVSSTDTYNADKQRVDTTHRATYVVQMDSESARENSVANVAGVPRIGTPSPIMLGAYCVSRDISEIGPKTFEVEAEFSTNIEGGNQPDDRKPWDRTPEWSWSFETTEEPMLTDAQNNSKAIANSALEPLPPVTQLVAVPVLQIKRTELSFNGQTILDYVNRVNSSAFWGASANQALMAGINASQKQFDSFRVWEVTYTIKFKVDTYGWKLRLLDQGTYYWSGAVGTSQKIPFGDAAFQQVVGNLNGSGGENTTTTPSFVTYNRYDDANFNNLKLGPWG